MVRESKRELFFCSNMAAVMSGTEKQVPFLSTEETSAITFSLKMEFHLFTSKIIGTFFFFTFA